MSNVLPKETLVRTSCVDLSTQVHIPVWLCSHSSLSRQLCLSSVTGQALGPRDSEKVAELCLENTLSVVRNIAETNKLHSVLARAEAPLGTGRPSAGVTEKGHGG